MSILGLNKHLPTNLTFLAYQAGRLDLNRFSVYYIIISFIHPTYYQLGTNYEDYTCNEVSFSVSRRWSFRQDSNLRPRDLSINAQLLPPIFNNCFTNSYSEAKLIPLVCPFLGGANLKVFVTELSAIGIK